MGDVDVTASQWRLVEVGRVVLFVSGPYAGKLAAIAEIIDHKRVLVEGPASNAEDVVPRQSAPLSNLSLTRFVLEKLPRGAGTAPLRKQWEAQEIEKKFNNSDYAKKREQTTKRRNLNDFERFKVMRLRKQARFQVRKTMAAAKAA
ncbi:hypothetical protein WHR41_05741 [Cladosporium halotolerans]|uniref:60S ribosomal protein L14 n=1 Tax=Cladosporium halotolerans TaxID=1052096 RepID=A0AB34KJY3_9PEZI